MADSLEPGAVICPIIDDDAVTVLAERLYGITVVKLTQLNGYDDKNYRVITDTNMKNPFISSLSEHGYVLKIMNSIDTQNAAVVEAQNEIMNFLAMSLDADRSTTCPKPVRNVFGHQYSIETISGKQHAVRLLEYIPGELLKNVPITEALLYQLGEFVADLDNKLQNFNHSGVVKREHTWMLTKVPDLEKFMYVIKDQEKYDLAKEVIEEFKNDVVPRLDKLVKGVIHGDVNDMNVLVGLKPGGSDTEYQVTGIIDFGDIQYSCYVFELAIAMTYMMLITGDPRVGGYVFAGYTVNRRLSDEEYGLLKTLISSRLVQSLVMGAYTLEQEPNNIYVASTEKANGWELLRKIWKTRTTEDEDPCDWKRIANEYLTKS